MTKPGLLHELDEFSETPSQDASRRAGRGQAVSAGGDVTVEEAAASAIKHVTDGIDDEEAMNRAPDLLAALAAAGWAVVPVVATEEMIGAGWSEVGMAECDSMAPVWAAMLAARPR